MNSSSAQMRLRRNSWQVQPYHLLIAAWVLTMISIPIVRWFIGDDALRWGVMVSVSFLAAAIVTILWQAWGAARTLQTVLVVIGFSWAIEWVGSTTGLPFGRYYYTEALTPQVLHVPLAIPLAWLMMLPPAWAVAALIGGSWRGWRFVLLSAAAFTAWDFFLDPQMVDWGFWVWENPGGYFGIPWINFGGWLLSAALLTLLARPLPLPSAPLLVIYAITWVLQTIGQLFFWQMPGPALTGFFAMGFFLVLAWRKSTFDDRPG